MPVFYFHSLKMRRPTSAPAPAPASMCLWSSRTRLSEFIFLQVPRLYRATLIFEKSCWISLRYHLRSKLVSNTRGEINYQQHDLWLMQVRASVSAHYMYWARHGRGSGNLQQSSLSVPAVSSRQETMRQIASLLFSLQKVCLYCFG